MIELKISNGEYLTHEDLEKYLNEYEEFYNSSLDNGMLEYEWTDFITENNNKIEKTISNTPKIELIVSDIERVQNYQPSSFTGHLEIQTSKGNIIDKVIDEEDLSIHLRGNEKIGNWKKWNERYRFYEDIAIDEVFIIKFKKIEIKKIKKPPYKEGTISEYTVPDVSFLKIVTKKPIGLKKGDRILFNLNITKRVRFKGKYEYIYLNYIETVNLNPPTITEVSTNSSNSNCFVVTATMGDINHPVVNDFRNYRDEVLLNTISGRLFIKLYYQIGPYLSEIIKNNKTLFQISRSFILKLHKRIIKN